MFASFGALPQVERRGRSLSTSADRGAPSSSAARTEGESGNRLTAAVGRG
jgi:hypothetical protein